jgi:hypothetical protein
MKLHFYIPEHHLPSKERQDEWMAGRIPSLLEGGKSASAQAWLYQTWAELRTLCECSLVTKLPTSGIIITLSNLLPEGFRASSSQFVATVVADFLPHTGAHLQIIQNAAHARRLPGSVFMPHWPQPNLIPRDPLRGDRLETAAFFGDPSNLLTELADPHFASRLRNETGVELEIRGADRWHDYSDVDLVLAVRDFSRSRHLHKPATKLYNAWLAGVPLIGGSDSAYAAEAEAGSDYLAAHSTEDCIRLVKELRDIPSLRNRIVESGQKKSASRSRDAVRNKWRDFCVVELPERLRQWERKSLLEKRFFWASQKSLHFIDRKFRY